ncbi:iron ABC transporter substrate-binding protein [Pseudodesulfovibrio sp.]|uniref:iron ABC transporter substrate-binding protein n=1 Tax=Pseudodesulfovibrio sp. TaxID=2035812 RepID=UPI002608312D|nr:iron ABC transporter substrate-binding protein [Pseudodesulfovibrio sp.]MDD3310500.1 iron ABC transporter substrate-binding protein [Pseudodesulfovibrio sp.]
MKRCIYALVLVLAMAAAALAGERAVEDGRGKSVVIPDKVERVICSGPGSLRLLTYLQAQDRIVAVDDIETRRRAFDARPYSIANPQFRKMPVFGEFRGHDNPELILTLDPQPQVILKTYPTMGHDPDELARKTGIPVVTLNYGNLFSYKKDLFRSLRIVGEVVGKEERAGAVIAYMQGLIDDLRQRTADIPADKRPTVFVGGVAFKGPHGYQSTEPAYPPFQFVNANNLAYREGLKGKELSHADVSKEMIVKWNPDFLFLDLSTLQLGDETGGLFELRHDPAYQTLTAVKQGKVYGLLPYNWYTSNFGCTLANAYFIGKLLYPGRFADVDPAAKADEIFTFLVGKPVFKDMDAMFRNLAYKPVPLR